MTAALPLKALFRVQPVRLVGVMTLEQRFYPSFGDLSLSVSGPGYHLNLYLTQLGKPRNCAGVWWGHEYRTDATGAMWSRPAHPHVVDDFGALVPVPAGLPYLPPESVQ